jgi:PAS domain S-box-containing protein
MALLARADEQSKVSNYFQELFQRSRFALHQGAARQIDLTNCRGGALEMPSRTVNRKNKAGRGGKRDATRRQSVKRLVQLERELRANKARWQAVVANPFMGVTVLSKIGHFMAANSAFQAMVGYTDDELKKLTPLDITPAGDREANKILLRELQRGKRQHYELTKRLQRKDGEVIWVQLYVFGIPDHGAVGMTINITAKMRAENELRIAQAELARSAHVSRMGAMTASIAHEINQPLAAIVANASAGLRWMERTPPDLAEARESFEQIGQEGRRAADVIESVRSMFKSTELPHAPIDLNQLIREVVALVDGAVQKHGIVVRTELDETLVPVTGNRVQLQQVLFNLLSNAIEAMESLADRRMLVISELESGGEVRVTIEDSGSGIDPKDFDKIFNSFFTTKAEGMGMGLSICRSIVESHGGRLVAPPGQSRGAAFQFTLPAGAPGDH